MFRQSNRGTLVWLVIVGAALGLTLLAGGVPTGLGAALLAAYLLLRGRTACPTTIACTACWTLA